ncbi:MAG: hypothetical protein HRU11_13210 [Parvularculaceae bacterium]|nr:hypothetical protein [Parvularculaceae bacterium]
MMGDLGDALSFGNYGAALQQAAAMHPSDYSLAEMVIVGGLGAGAVLMLVLMLVRRSGTAAAGFALVALFALSMAMLFGSLDFLTRGTRLLIGCLTASALVLFVNAVLHTGRENLLVAGLSAVVIGVLITLGGLSATGMGYANEAKLAMIAASLFAVLTLVFAVFRPSFGRIFLVLCVFVAVASGAFMLDTFSVMLDGLWMTVAPAGVASGALLLAALAAPFLADEVRLGSAAAAAAGGYGASMAMEPGPLFQGFDDDDGRADANDDPFFAASMGDPEPYQAEPQEELPPFIEGVQANHRAEAMSPLESPPQFPDPEPAETGPVDPVSSYWSAGAGAALETQADEYVWDALADQEVRCGDDVLRAFAARSPLDLTPEGLRERIDPRQLPDFDQHVLGGGDPVSGPFDIAVQTQAAAFRFVGRRQVDHDGILMRLDGEIREAAAPASAPTTPQQAYQAPEPAVAQEPMARSGMMLDLETRPVVRLGDRGATGFDATPSRSPKNAEELRELIDKAAMQLAAMIEQDPRSGAFAVIDGHALGARADVLASAVGRAVTSNKLPRGAFLVGLDVASLGSPRAIQRATEDIRAAGGGAAFIVRDGGNKLGKLRPDMIWIDAMDAQLERRRRSVVEALNKRFGVPVLIRDIHDGGEAESARDQGARFATGRPFGQQELPPVAMPDAAVPPSATPSPAPAQQSAPAPAPHHPAAPSSVRSLKSQGLR